MLKIIGGLADGTAGFAGSRQGQKKPVPKDRLFYVQCVCRS